MKNLVKLIWRKIANLVIWHCIHQFHLKWSNVKGTRKKNSSSVCQWPVLQLKFARYAESGNNFCVVIEIGLHFSTLLYTFSTSEQQTILSPKKFFLCVWHESLKKCDSLSCKKWKPVQAVSLWEAEQRVEISRHHLHSSRVGIICTPRGVLWLCPCL